MKKALILVFSLFLLSSLNCATTEQEVSKTEETTQEAEKATETVVGNFDLNGTWKHTDKWNGCGNETKTYTVKITQKGDSVTIVNLETKNTAIGKVYNDTIIFPSRERVVMAGEGSQGTLRIKDFKLKISSDANTLTGKQKWFWMDAKGANCDVVSNLTYKRK